MSAAEPHEPPSGTIYPPEEALRNARLLPPPDQLVDEDLTQRNGSGFRRRWLRHDRRPAAGVVDTMVISWLLDDRPKDLAGHDRELIGATPTAPRLSGAVAWKRRVAQIVVAQPDDATITI